MRSKANRKAHRLAHRIVYAANQEGVLDRNGECDSCGTRLNLVQHHDDYRKPLEVRLLCRSCHTTLHHKLRREGQFLPV